jgi:phage tail tape-measure protein
MMVVDQCVRLGMAIVIIALVSLALYQFSGRGRVNAQEINQVLAPASGAAASHGLN